MRTSKVAKRYAQGLLNFTQEVGNTTSVFGEMKDLVNTIEKSKELQSFFNSPIIDSKKKISIANEIFKSFSAVSQNIIQLVIKQGREGQLSNIGQEFINKVEDMNGVQRITLTSATALSQDNMNNILKSTTLVNHNNQFDVKSIINPDILGGYILRVGDQQIDASVKSKLSRLKKEFQLN
ncbi:ATP synthase F1 subunit delta [Kaistella sp.]|uniref:ATP synthase F1 subunit delta n=1 Tax=Kaistella sp. TaxID=2782235 RepID=UPI003C68492F